MATLSPAYLEVKRLRSRGDCAGAVATLRSRPPASDEDAFEAVVCLFVCGDVASAVNVCRTHRWQKNWAVDIASAVAERATDGNAGRAVERARRAARSTDAPHDVAAMYLMLLQEAGGLNEAAAFIHERLDPLPTGEPFLLTLVAETALALQDWRQAYRAATAVLAHDPDDHRALLALSHANVGIGNLDEALGNAKRAATIERSPDAVLQIMRCENKLGDHYAALAALENLPEGATLPYEIRVERAVAYTGVGERTQAVAEYHAALQDGAPPAPVLRALLELHAADGEDEAIEALHGRHRAVIEADFTSMYWIGVSALHRGDLGGAAQAFAASHALAAQSPDALHATTFPVAQARLRHDVEQLELLQSREKLDVQGGEALELLRRYYDPHATPEAVVTPGAGDAQALERALARVHHLPQGAFEGRALGDNDYAAIEDEYLRGRLVVIDGFLSAGALATFRRFSEEATVWNAIYNRRGYVGAVLAQGFAPRVLLAIIDELRRAMPRVIGELPLLQAWGFKYDQRMRGIDLHADFARVNANFWLAPDESCEDLTTGGLVVYDEPVPEAWTFADYNSDPERLAAYVRAHRVQARRVPYRGNRCVLFDSSLIHATDEVHFRPGYENRRVNVTLLYGKGLSV